MAIPENVVIETEAQRAAQAALDEIVAAGLETGVMVAAYLEGKLVVDAWAGQADRATGAPVAADTLFFSFSCSKGVTATVIHQLAERGLLGYHDPVARYWPEFGAKGKADITIRQVLVHSAGVPFVSPDTTPAMLADWETMRRQLEAMKPLWSPGSKTAYHSFTYGFILGELAQRVDGRPFARIVQEDICARLGVDDLYFGIPPEVDPRVATVSGDRVPWFFLPTLMWVRRAVPPALEPGPVFNSAGMRSAVIPAGNMITSARSLARHYAALIGDGVDGVRLLPPERVALAARLANDSPDGAFFGAHIKRGLGYWLGGDSDNAFGSRLSVFGHTGAGGSIGFADPEYNFSFALLKNRATWRGEQDTDIKLARVVRKALGIPD